MAWHDRLPQRVIAARLGVNHYNVCRILYRARVRLAKHGIHVPKFSRQKRRIRAGQLSVCSDMAGI